MPLPGKAWWHVIWHTYATWLPGDPRGFRTRGHRIHSSGDYKNPPPAGEHEKLHRHHRRLTKGEVVLRTKAERRQVGEAIAATLTKDGHAMLIVSVGRTHVHAIAQMPVERRAFDRTIARLKTWSSRSIRHKVAGHGWARGRKAILIHSVDQREGTFIYVKDWQEHSAVRLFPRIK